MNAMLGGTAKINPIAPRVDGFAIRVIVSNGAKSVDVLVAGFHSGLMVNDAPIAPGLMLCTTNVAKIQWAVKAPNVNFAKRQAPTLRRAQAGLPMRFGGAIVSGKVD